MMKKTVITISRELGSGGNKIAEELSKRLSIPYYDKDILAQTAKEFGAQNESARKGDEKKTNSFLYSLATAQISGANVNAFALNDIIVDDSSFMLTSETIKRLAARSCIIVGRCADYVLRDMDIVKLFICADVEDRIKRVSESLKINEKNALKLIQKTDKRRAAYYNSYTDGEWGKASNYHLTINTSALGIENSVDVIEKFIRTYSEKQHLKS